MAERVRRVTQGSVGRETQDATVLMAKRVTRETKVSLVKMLTLMPFVRTKWARQETRESQAYREKREIVALVELGVQKEIEDCLVGPVRQVCQAQEVTRE